MPSRENRVKIEIRTFSHDELLIAIVKPGLAPDHTPLPNKIPCWRSRDLSTVGFSIAVPRLTRLVLLLYRTARPAACGLKSRCEWHVSSQCTHLRSSAMAARMGRSLSRSWHNAASHNGMSYRTIISGILFLAFLVTAGLLYRSSSRVAPVRCAACTAMSLPHCAASPWPGCIAYLLFCLIFCRSEEGSACCVIHHPAWCRMCCCWSDPHVCRPVSAVAVCGDGSLVSSRQLFPLGRLAHLRILILLLPPQIQLTPTLATFPSPLGHGEWNHTRRGPSSCSSRPSSIF